MLGVLARCEVEAVVESLGILRSPPLVSPVQQRSTDASEERLNRRVSHRLAEERVAIGLAHALHEAGRHFLDPSMLRHRELAQQIRIGRMRKQRICRATHHYTPRHLSRWHFLL